jgi:hypothetical protein
MNRFRPVRHITSESSLEGASAVLSVLGDKSVQLRAFLTTAQTDQMQYGADTHSMARKDSKFFVRNPDEEVTSVTPTWGA